MMYSIAQAAEKSGLSVHTLRYYDKEGLLPFIERTSSGLRRFSDNDLEALTVIACLKETGMEIKDIRIFMDWCRQGDATIQKRYDMFVNQKKKLEEKLADMNKHMDKINYKIWYYKTAAEAGTLEVHKKNKPPVYKKVV